MGKAFKTLLAWLFWVASRDFRGIRHVAFARSPRVRIKIMSQHLQTPRELGVTTSQRWSVFYEIHRIWQEYQWFWIIFCSYPQILHPNSRKYFLCTLGAPYNLELELGCPSGWMHINGIYIGYRTKINPDEKYFAKKYIFMIFWKMLEVRLELLTFLGFFNNPSRTSNIFQKIMKIYFFAKYFSSGLIFVL